MQTSSDLINEAVNIAGSQKALADGIGVTQQLISLMCRGAATVSAESAVAIEKFTEGKITRRQLRPDLFEAAA